MSPAQRRGRAGKTLTASPQSLAQYTGVAGTVRATGSEMEEWPGLEQLGQAPQNQWDLGRIIIDLHKRQENPRGGVYPDKRRNRSKGGNVHGVFREWLADEFGG